MTRKRRLPASPLPHSTGYSIIGWSKRPSSVPFSFVRYDPLVRVVSLVLVTMTAVHAACGCFMHHSHTLSGAPGVESACACRHHETVCHHANASQDAVDAGTSHAHQQHGDTSFGEEHPNHDGECPHECDEGQCVFVATKSSVNVDSINSAPLVSFDASAVVPPCPSLWIREAPASADFCSGPLRSHLALQILLI